MKDKDKKKKKPYVKPNAQVIKIKMEQPILTGSASNFDNGGRWGWD